MDVLVPAQQRGLPQARDGKIAPYSTCCKADVPGQRRVGRDRLRASLLRAAEPPSSPWSNEGLSVADLRAYAPGLAGRGHRVHRPGFVFSANTALRVLLQRPDMAFLYRSGVCCM